jgi:2-succinyl-6-hydroxy-2,4-cyclohexadiene-1-carboxylate synthase
MVRGVEHVVALHGFTGTGRLWDPAAALLDAGEMRVWAPDLPGHGMAATERPVTFERCVERVLAGAPDRFVLCGYSLGGRVALHVALAAPERVTGLVLVATTAGIEDDGERAARRAADEALAAEFEELAISQVADRWLGQTLFAADPPDARELQRRDVLRNVPSGLAAALRGTGTGVMTPLWDRLGELTMPATMIAGERDAKYVALGERLAAALPGAGPPVVVPGAGHGLPREAPEAVAAALRSLPRPSPGTR